MVRPGGEAFLVLLAHIEVNGAALFFGEEVFFGDAGHGVFFVPLGISFFLVRKFREEADAGLVGVVAIAGRVGAEEIVSALCFMEGGGRLHRRAKRQVVGEAFGDYAQEGGGGDSGDDGEALVLVCLPAEDIGEDAVSSHCIEGPPISAFNVESPGGQDCKKQEETGTGKEGGDFLAHADA